MEVKNKLRLYVIDLNKDDDNILIKEMIARVFTPSLCPFYKPRVELRDKNLEDKKFQFEEPQQNVY